METKPTLFKRDMQSKLCELAEKYPVITITGPRQSGKTTLVKTSFPNKPYLNLESVRTRELAHADPVGFLDNYPDGAIIDEIQHLPLLLCEIQVRVDAAETNGMYIVTGSYQLGLQNAVAQSLAGRTAILNLLPLSLSELLAAPIAFKPNDILLQGCFPRVHKHQLVPSETYNYYVQTYLERDLRQITDVKNLSTFQKFMKLCAGRIGQILSKDSLANEVGVSTKTITHWLSILEASCIIVLLPPYFENFGKRVIKSPKLYFCDVGLAAYLLGIETVVQMERDPLRGHLFENLVILELIKHRWNSGLTHNLYYYRDSNQHEIDVLFQAGHQLVPIEIKFSMSFSRSFCKGLDYFVSLVKERALHPCIIYAGEDEQQIKHITLRNYVNAAKAIEPAN